MFWLTLIHLDRRNIKYPLDLTMVHTKYTIEESFNIYIVTGNYVQYLLRYHSGYIKSFLWSRYNLRCFYIMPSCYVYWPRCHQPELSKALEKKSVYIFLVSMIKCFGLKNSTNWCIRELMHDSATFCRVTLLLKIDKLYPFNFIFYYLIDMF